MSAMHRVCEYREFVQPRVRERIVNALAALPACVPRELAHDIVELMLHGYGVRVRYEFARSHLRWNHGAYTLKYGRVFDALVFTERVHHALFAEMYSKSLWFTSLHDFVHALLEGYRRAGLPLSLQTVDNDDPVHLMRKVLSALTQDLVERMPAQEVRAHFFSTMVILNHVDYAST
jgi:hypothetical protein